MTPTNYIQDFLGAMKTRRNLSLRTLKAYQLDLIAFRLFFSKKSLLKIDSSDIQTFINHLDEKKLSSATIKRKLATIKVFYSFLYAEEIIDEIPIWKSTGRYRTVKQIPRALSKHEIIQLLTTAHRLVYKTSNQNQLQRYASFRNLLVVELLFALGLRIDELTRLNVNDIDLDSGSLVVYGKGRKERLLYLSSQEVRDLICEYFPLRNKVAEDTRAFFVNRFGQRLGNSSVGRIFSNLSEKAGLQRHYTPHCLRHTMATMLIENGADVRSVQEILGHSSISTTEIYLHVSQKRKEQVLGRFNERNNLTLLSTPPSPTAG